MRVKLLVLFAIIALPSCYAIWKNSTMSEIDFDTAYDKLEMISIGGADNAFIDNDIATMHYDNDMTSIREIYEASDVVAIVKPVSRKQEATIINTSVEIKKNLKSDFEVGQQISLFEQAEFQYDYIDGVEYTLLYTNCGYVPMDPSKEYLVFLKKSEGYTSNQYGFISLLYGKFPYLDKQPKVLELPTDPNGSIDYPMDDIYNYDVVLFDILEKDTESNITNHKENVAKYNIFKKDYMDLLQGFIDNKYDIEKIK